MIPGETVTIGDYSFTATFHGPMIQTSCVDCGHRPIGVVVNDSYWLSQARCTGCWRKRTGVDK